jgi:membrane protease YdiL (CAAX protease family)
MLNIAEVTVPFELVDRAAGLLALLVILACLRSGARPLLGGARPDAGGLWPGMIPVPLLGYLFAFALLEALARALAGGPPDETTRITLNSVSQAVGAAFCLLIAAKVFPHGVRGFLVGNGGLARPVAASLLCLLAIGPLCELVAQVTQMLLAPVYDAPQHRVLVALERSETPIWARAVLWFGAAVVVPVAEECFFRGILQTALANLLRSRGAAILLASILFGLAHAQQWHVVPALVLFGITLGLLYERSQALVAPIVLHALFNIKTLVWHLLGAAAVP